MDWWGPAGLAGLVRLRQGRLGMAGAAGCVSDGRSRLWQVRLVWDGQLWSGMAGVVGLVVAQ
jgi:hypothetical protein